MTEQRYSSASVQYMMYIESVCLQAVLAGGNPCSGNKCATNALLTKTVLSCILVAPKALWRIGITKGLQP